MPYAAEFVDQNTLYVISVGQIDKISLGKMTCKVDS